MLLVVTTLGAVLLALPFCSTKRQNFDADVWRSLSQEGCVEDRHLMVDDLLENHLHVGQKFDDVRALLGRWEMFLDLDSTSWRIAPDDTRGIVRIGYPVEGVFFGQRFLFLEFSQWRLKRWYFEDI